jgi:hypothetical protein
MLRTKLFMVRRRLTLKYFVNNYFEFDLTLQCHRCALEKLSSPNVHSCKDFNYVLCIS